LITEALLHCAGIGPVRLAQLNELGIRTWTDVLDQQESLPPARGRALAEECTRCLTALDTEDIRYFTNQFAPRDKWRILTHFLDQASFFDIETVGLEYDAAITVICCWHDGQLHHFVEHENLDEFLLLLDEIKLLVSFNGSSFDVPRILDAFHIPDLPCAHLDMRWTCFHQGETGGLKEIATRAGIARPHDLDSADGELAVQLWFDWQRNQNATARKMLIRYCASDVLLLLMLAHQQAGRTALSHQSLWESLPKVPDGRHDPRLPRRSNAPPTHVPSGTFGAAFENMFGTASPNQLRGRRRKLIG